MLDFSINLIEPYLKKEKLSEQDIDNLKKMLHLNGDFTPVYDFFVKIGLLDSITINLLKRTANEKQVKMMLDGSIPLKIDQKKYLVFFVLKYYRNLVKELYNFLSNSDIIFKRELINDVLFTDSYLTFLTRLLKNDELFVSELIASHRYNSSHIKALITSEEPEILFKVSNLINILKENVEFIDELLKNPYTPDESIIALKQLLVDIKNEYEEKLKTEKSDEPEKEIEEPEEQSEKTNEDSKALEILTKDESEIDAEIENNLFAKVLSMKMPEKMKLAMKGNKTARMLLLKDPNKQISLAALNNPRITDNEIALILKNRSTGEHIIREVARNRTWMKDYNIMKDLVSHPKTPMEISSRLLGRLYINDLGRLAKSKDIPANLRTMAARMYEVKNKRK